MLRIRMLGIGVDVNAWCAACSNMSPSRANLLKSEVAVTDVSKLEAGPELDGLIANRIFGLAPGRCQGEVKENEGEIFCTRCFHCWDWTKSFVAEHDFTPEPYSTSITSAWKVVEHLEMQGIDLGRVGKEFGEGLYLAQFFNGKTYGHACKHARGETAPLAICLAALETLQVTK